MTQISIIGGGIAGLVAAIEVAEAGESAVVYEAQSRLGGRARTEDGPYRTNLGAHALYLGAFTDWMTKRGILPAGRPPRKTAFKLARNDRVLRLPLPLLPMLRTLKREAPVDLDYRSWAREVMSDRGAEAAIGFAALPTFHGDPGALSAAFVHERLQRSFRGAGVLYVEGGFASIVDALARHARKLGVRIETGAKRSSVTDQPSIVATDLRSAARLLDDPSIDWPRPRTAIFDVAIRPRRGDRWALLDLDRRVYVSNYSAYDATLAPKGERLYQCVAGLREGEDLSAGLDRIHETLDLAVPGWTDRTTWAHRGLSEGAGPADPPGTTWADRPEIDRGEDRWLAGDSTAAPGLLCEVAHASGIEAAKGAVAAVQRARPRSVRAVA